MDVFDLAAKITLDASEYTNGLASAGEKTNAFSALAQSVWTNFGLIVVAGVAKATQALTGFVSDSVSVGAAFDQSMSQVVATMGYSTDEIDEAGTEAAETYQKLRDFALDMGSTTVFTATQAAEALNYMALAGYDAEKSMSMLPTVLNLAAAGGMDLATASDMVTDAQSALGLTMDETTVMVNEMARTAASSNTSVSQLGEAILTLGGTARYMYGGTEELSTVLGILADNGIKGSEAGTHLRNMILSLSSPTDDASKLIQSLGLQIFDAEGNMRSFADIFGDMAVAMADMTDAEKLEAFGELFNTRDIASATALLNTTQERWSELGATIASAGEAASDMADTQLDNLAGDITLFQSAMEGAKIVISDKLTPTLRKFTQYGSESVSKLANAFREDGLEGALDALDEVVDDGIDMITDMIPEAIEIGGRIITAFGKGLIENLPKIYAGFKEGVSTLLQTIFGNETTEKITSLWSKVDNIITTAFDSIYRVAEPLTNILGTLFDVFLDVANVALDILQPALEILGFAFDSVVFVVDALIGKHDEGTRAVSAYVLETQNAVEAESEYRQSLEDSLVAYQEKLEAQKETNEGIASEYSHYGELADRLSEIVDDQGNIKKGYEEEAATITSVLKDALGIEIDIVNGQIQKYQDLQEEIQKTILVKQAEALENAGQSTYNDALEKETELYNQIIEAENKKKEASTDVTEAQGKLNDAIAAYSKLVTDYGFSLDDVNNWEDNAIEATKSQVDALKSAYDAMLDAKDGLYNMRTAYEETESAVAAATEEYQLNEEVITNYEGLISAMASGTMEDLNNAIAMQTENLRTAENSNEETLLDQYEAFDQTYKDMLTAQQEGDTLITESMLEKAKERRDLAADELLKERGVWESGMSDIARYSLLGLTDGMYENIESVKTAGSDVGRAAMEAMQKAMQINSPSKVTQEFGRYLDLGLAEGIADNSDIAETAAGSMAESVIESIGEANDAMIDTDGFTGSLKDGVKFSFSTDSIEEIAQAIATQISNRAQDINISLTQLLDGDKVWERMVKVNKSKTLANGVNALA